MPVGRGGGGDSRPKMMARSPGDKMPLGRGGGVNSVGSEGRLSPPPPLPTGILYSPQFPSH